VTVEFGWGRDMDFAAIDVREKLDVLRLPDAAEAPVLLRFDPGSDPVMRLYLRGVDDLFELREIAEEVVEKDLESTPGVAAIEVRGGYEDEIEIEVDEGRLALSGLTMAEVATRLGKANVDQAGGSLYEREARYLVRARNRLESLDDIRSTVIVDRDGRRVTVGDVAEVRRTHRERETITRLQGTEAVELAIFEEGDANTTTVAAAVHARLEQVRERLPDGVELVVATDQSTFIQASVDEVLSSAAIGGAFAVLVLMLFLRDVRNTVIVALSIPLSVIATFFLMYQTDTTLNVMSLGGLALGVGMLVDNAIVVLESIHRHREAGADPVAAARAGAAEVGRAVTASTLTTVAVFLPVVFLEGVAAQLFRDMAVTVCFSLVVSLAVSLTLIPVMAATGVAGPVDVAPRSWPLRIVTAPLRLLRWLVAGLFAVLRFAFRPVALVFDRVLGRLTARYPVLLRGSLRRPATVLGIAGLMFAGAVLSIPRIGLDLIPAMSQGEFSFVIELAEGRPLTATDRVVDDVQSVLEGDPRVERYASIAGRAALGRTTTSTDGEHTALLQVRMAEGTTPDDEAAVIDALRDRLADAYVHRVRLERPSVFSLRRPVEVELHGDDPDALREAAEQVQARVSVIEGVVEARSSAELGHPEVQVHFDRERLGALGLDVADVAATVRHKLQGEVSTRFLEGDREIDMRLRSLGRAAATPADVREIIVAKKGRAPIRLDAVARVELATGPSEIHRRGQNRVAVVSADVRGRDMGALEQDLRAALAEIELPDGVQARLAGQEQEMARSLRSLLLALALAAFLVYLVMAAQFESLLHPFVVIFTLPLAAIGVVAAMLLTGGSFSAVSMIGVVMLAGIVVNNAIVLVDAVNQRRAEGMSKLDAIVTAGQSRLRPILMTSGTTVLGLLPLAFATGAAAELRAALAVAVIGGLTVATVLTLLVIPVVYALVDRKRFAEPRS
jgi:HAE1 family hydrophobic/amphiphilic exporter-1